MEHMLHELASKELTKQEPQALVALLSGRGPATVKVANYWDRNHCGHHVCQLYYYRYYDFHGNKHHHSASTQLLLQHTLQFKHRYRNDHYRQHLKRNHCIADFNNH